MTHYLCPVLSYPLLCSARSSRLSFELCCLQTDIQTGRCTDRQMHRQTDAQTDRYIDRQMHRQTDRYRYTDRSIIQCLSSLHNPHCRLCVALTHTAHNSSSFSFLCHLLSCNGRTVLINAQYLLHRFDIICDSTSPSV
jgi:hypothetical protein